MLQTYMVVAFAIKNTASENKSHELFVLHQTMKSVKILLRHPAHAIQLRIYCTKILMENNIIQKRIPLHFIP